MNTLSTSPETPAKPVTTTLESALLFLSWQSRTLMKVLAAPVNCITPAAADDVAPTSELPMKRKLWLALKLTSATHSAAVAPHTSLPKRLRSVEPASAAIAVPTLHVALLPARILQPRSEQPGAEMVMGLATVTVPAPGSRLSTQLRIDTLGKSMPQVEVAPAQVKVGRALPLPRPMTVTPGTKLVRYSPIGMVSVWPGSTKIVSPPLGRHWVSAPLSELMQRLATSSESPLTLTGF